MSASHAALTNVARIVKYTFLAGLCILEVTCIHKYLGTWVLKFTIIFITIYVHVFVWYAKGSFADVAVSFSFFYCTCIVISRYKAKYCDTECFSNL